jgi:hypothetical protein
MPAFVSGAERVGEVIVYSEIIVRLNPLKPVVLLPSSLQP